MNAAQLSHIVLRTVRGAVQDGELRVSVPERIRVERPRGVGGGARGRAEYVAGPVRAHWATNAALRLAKEAGQSPLGVAETLRTRLLREVGIAEVEITAPGFLNITVADDGDGGRAALVAQLMRKDWRRAVDGRETHPDDPQRDAERWAAATGVPAGRVPELLRPRHSNPLFRVRYAHARTRALLRNARDLGFAPDPGVGRAEGTQGTATRSGTGGAGRATRSPYERPTSAESVLLALLAEHPLPSGTPSSHTARRLVALADAFFRCHDDGAHPILPRGDEKPGAVHRARLALAQAAGAALADGLHRLGVSAPAHL